MKQISRYRPDQRALEEGKFAEAENVKLGLEQAQRDRRRQRDHGQVPERGILTLSSEQQYAL